MSCEQWLTTFDARSDASKTLAAQFWAYLDAGAGSNKAVSDNVSAFEDFWLIPHLADSSQAAVKTETTLFGQSLRSPILIAPTSPQRLFHSQAELAMARAAARFGTISIVSADSHYPFAEISNEGKDACWFQLYGYGERPEVEKMLELAIEGKAMAIVVTIDASYSAQRVSAAKAGFELPSFVEMGNLKSLGIDTASAKSDGRLPRAAMTWSELAWLRSLTNLPFLVKGVLNVSDAKRCVDIGADGVIVSNHGGRQLDSSLPSVFALERVAAAVRDQCVVLMDSGVRSGVDVVKALALGADAVCIGRPTLWGLAADGERGVTAILDIFQMQLEDALRQLGLCSTSELSPECIIPARNLR